jgi:plasmid stabilization system protein ParE
MIRYTSFALREIDEILDYIERDNTRACENVRIALQRTITWIARRPRMSPIIHRDVRAKLVLGYQYRIFYVIDGPDIEIRSVRSTRRLRPWEDPSR